VIRSRPSPALVTLALAFLLLGALVSAEWTQSLDEEASLALQRGGTPWQAFYEAVSRPLDTWRGLASAVVVVLGTAWLAGRRAALFVLLAGGGAVLISYLAKLSYGRARPGAPIEVLIVQPVTSSFPSGHVAWTAGFAGALACLAWQDVRRGRAALLISCCAAATVLMALSRVYLGQHFLTDVLGGTLIGALAVGLARPLLREGKT
jgi:membrane-associated phospholipid phosphatase